MAAGGRRALTPPDMVRRLVVRLPPGTYDIVVSARSTVTWTFNNARVIRVTVL